MNDRVTLLWETFGKLTYAELIGVGQQLLDTQDTLGLETKTAETWAELIDAARESYLSDEKAEPA